MKRTRCTVRAARLKRGRMVAFAVAAMMAGGSASAVPGNDTCTGATPILSASFEEHLLLGNSAINNDVVAGGCSSTFIGRGIWYTYTPTQTSFVTLTFNITVTPPDTLTTTNGGRFISVYSSTGVCTGLAIATPCVNTLSNASISTSSFTAAAGTTYYIAVGSARVGSALPPSATYNFSFNAVALPPPPTNDECGGAVPLSSAMSSWTIDASGSADDAMNSSCGPTAKRGVWYRYDSMFAGRATFNFDSLGAVATDTGKNVSVYTGTCGMLTPVPNTNYNTAFAGSSSTCQTATGINTPARFTFDVSPGVTYYILAASGTGSASYPPGAEYTLSFEAVPAPINDTCVQATAISSLPYSATVNVGGATNSMLNLVPFSHVEPIADIWYTYTPTSDQMVKVNWSGPYQALNQSVPLDYYKGAGTAVYTGACGSLKPVGQLVGTPDEAVVVLRGGTTYFFMMGRRNRHTTSSPIWPVYAEDTYTFEITTVPGTPPAASPNDNCENALPITSFPLSETVNVIANNDDAVGPVCFPYSSNASTGPEIWTSGVWYTYTPPVDQFITGGPLAAENCDVIFYTGSCGSLTPVGCDGRTIGRTLSAGTTYFIYVATFPAGQFFTPRLIGQEYSFIVDVSTPPANDLCANAKTVPSLPYADTVDIGAAGNDSAGASCSGGAGSTGRGVWYRYTAPSNGPAIKPMAVWNSHGGPVRGAISVFDGGCGGSLITCGDPGSSAFFEAEAGQTYATLVGDYGNQSYYLENGPFDSTIEFYPAIPSDNLACSTAYEVTSFPFEAAADSSLGSVGTVPTGCNSFNQDKVYRAIYFTFTPAQSGTLTADISRSYGGDITVLYSGPCNNLTPISCTANIGQSIGSGNRGYTQPTLTAAVQAGVRYTLVLGIYLTMNPTSPASTCST